MTLATDRFRPCQHLLGGFEHSVVAMTNNAASHPHLREYRLMRALTVEIFEQGMACSAHGCHRADLRRRCPVISVTGSATGSRQVSTFCQSFPMNTLPIFFKLAGGNLVITHMRRTRVATGARFRKAQRMNRSTRIFHFSNVMNAMTIHTIGCGLISCTDPLAMNTG